MHYHNSTSFYKFFPTILKLTDKATIIHKKLTKPPLQTMLTRSSFYRHIFANPGNTRQHQILKYQTYLFFKPPSNEYVRCSLCPRTILGIIQGPSSPFTRGAPTIKTQELKKLLSLLLKDFKDAFIPLGMLIIGI